MKKTIQFAFAALAAFTFVSCSSDDLFGNGDKLAQQKKRGLTVGVEEMIDPLTTRAAMVPTDDNNGEHLWQLKDEIRVYDDALTKYDVYAYDGKIFASTEETNIIKNPTYAVFVPKTGGAELTKWEWVHDTKNSEITYTISPEDWTWAEDFESAGGDKVAYLSNLPMWGTVEEKDGELSADLKYLTAIMKINLVNVKENIKAIIVEGWEDKEGTHPVQMTGEFKAVLETKDGPKLDTQLEPTMEDATGYNKITVKLYDEETEEYKATQNSSYLFIPIIPRTYGKLTVSYINDEDETKEVRSVNSVTFERKQLRNFATPSLNDIKSNGKDIPALNEELEKLVEAQGEVTIETQNKTSVTAEANTIIIPEGMKAQKITLDLQGLTNEGAVLLNIKSADYAGELIIKVPGTVNEETGANENTASNKEVDITSVYVNMPKANVVFAGNWNGVTLGKTNVFESLIVNTLTIAEGATVANIYPNAESSENNTATPDILVAANGVVTGTLKLSDVASIDAITIDGKIGTLTATSKDLEQNDKVVEVTLGEKANVTTKMSTNQSTIVVPAGAIVKALDSNKEAKITVEGTVSTLNAYNGGQVFVSGGGKITTLNADTQTLGDTNETEVSYLEIAGTGSVTTANVRGANVFVNRAETGVAISTALNMGDGKTLNLRGGYIKALNGAGTEDTNEGITFKNEEADGVPTAIGTVKDVKLAGAYTSKWGGAVATTGYYLTTENSTANQIWTASQLAYYTGSSTAKLVADMDMNNKPFTPKAAVKAEFNGNDKTISNVSIERDLSNGAAGLFLSLAEDGSIKNLKVDGIKIEQKKATATIPTTSTYYVVGGLVANASGGLIDAVDVANAELTNANWTVGGLIGNVTGTVTITGSRTKGDYDAKTFSTVAAKSITGKNRLGGIVGQISTNGNVTITGYKADVTKFTVTEELNEKKDNRLNFGTVAPFVGTATAGELSVTTATAYATTPLTYAQKLDLGFDNNITADLEQNTYEKIEFYFVGRPEIGYVSATQFKLGINNTTTEYSSTSENLSTNVTKAGDVNKTAALNYYLLSTEYK